MNKSKYFYNNEEVKLMYTRDNESWIRLKDGSNLVVPFNRLNIKGRFEHLRNLPIDTKVLVKDLFDEDWEARHFSHVSDNGNHVVCFDGGMTSFTSKESGFSEWPLCEVYEE